MELRVDIPDWAEALVSDLTDMGRAPQPVDAARQPSLRFDLPDDVYFEYAFRDAAGALHPDPSREARTRNLTYGIVSSVFGPRYVADPLADPPAPAVPLQVDRLQLQSEVMGERRRVTVTAPAGSQERPLPLVLVQDGVAFHRTGRASDVLAELVRRGEARPARFAYVEPVDRTAEYGFGEAYKRFVVEELLPELAERYPSDATLVAMGASLGGLFSAVLGLEHPERVSAIVTFSGAFWGGPTDPDYYNSRASWLRDALEAGDGRIPDWYAECGTLEWLLEVNRRVLHAADGRAERTAYRERSAGHNWTNWRNGMASALRFALPPETGA